MRRRWVWVVAALAVGIGALVLVLEVLRPFSLVHPARQLRSYATLPPALAQPGFRAGPVFAGISVEQELALSPRDAAIRLWVSPARAGDRARVRIELLASPRGPSLRSGEIDLTSGSEALVARVAPLLDEHELGAGGRVLLRIVPTADSAPIQVGMARDDYYQPGQAFIADEPTGQDVNVMFEVGRTVPRSLRRRTGEAQSADLAVGHFDTCPSSVSRASPYFRHRAAPGPDPGAADARSDPVQAVRSALIRRMLVAVHTRSHSRAAGHWPRRLNCRNPRTRLIQP